MKSKDKIKKHAKVSLKGIVVFLASIIIVLNIIVAYAYFFQKDEVYAKETNTNVQNVKISNASALNVEEIMNKNAEEAQQDEYYVEETELEYITKYQQNEQLPTGVMQVIQEGRNGKQEITTKRSYKNGEVVLEEQISSKITKASINKIVEVGSGKGRSTYKVKVGDTVYVTSDRASVMTEPSEEAQKIATLTKGMDVKIVVIENGWYKISGQGVDGYIKGENTTYINPNAKYEGNINNNLENKNNIQSLRFDMALNKPSGLSLEQFKKVLTDSKDKNNIFKNNAQYFYYIEQQYNINGLFVAAVGIHESNWGTSKIAQNKHNLFGYGAYDSNRSSQ